MFFGRLTVGTGPENEAVDPHREPVVFTLSGAQGDLDTQAAHSSALPERLSTTLPAQTAPIDLTLATHLVPEWRIAKLSPSYAGPTSPTAQARGNGLAANGDGSGYDPYAGASPMRSSDRPAGASLAPSGAMFPDQTDQGGSHVRSTSAEWVLDRSLFDATVGAARQTAPRVHGILSLEVRIGPNGEVIAVQRLRRSGDPRLEALLIGALHGKRLFIADARGGAFEGATYKLPDIWL